MIGIIKDIKKLQSLNEVFLRSGNLNNKDVQKQIIHSVQKLEKKMETKKNYELIKKVSPEKQKYYLREFQVHSDSREAEGRPKASYPEWLNLGGYDLFATMRRSSSVAKHGSQFSYGDVYALFQRPDGKTVLVKVNYRLTKKFKEDYEILDEHDDELLNELFLGTGNIENDKVKQQIVHAIKVFEKSKDDVGLKLVKKVPPEVKKRVAKEIAYSPDSLLGRGYLDWFTIDGVDIFSISRRSSMRNGKENLSLRSFGQVYAVFQKPNNDYTFYKIPYRKTKHFKRSK